jgi:uncharacterized protein YbaP (TraB family)
MGRALRVAIVALPLTGALAQEPSATSREPRLWIARNGDARVFIFGFGEAKDSSWLTPTIRRAFDQSSQLWLETAGSATPRTQTLVERQTAAERMKRLAHESGRTFFDVLEPSVRRRTSTWLAELEIKRDSVETLRPWRAFGVIVSAFWSTRQMSYTPVPVDAVLREMAQAAGKRIDYEFPTGEAFATFMAAMPDRAQSQYIDWLLDFLDDYKKRLNDSTEAFSWIAGNPGGSPMRSLDRMRTKTPELYQTMQPQRNIWWARKAYDLLATGGTHFIAIGQLHVLGPDGVPRQLERLGIQVESRP